MRTGASREKPKPSRGAMPSRRSALPFSFSSWSTATAYWPGSTLSKVTVTLSAAATEVLRALASRLQRGKASSTAVMHTRTTPSLSRSPVMVTVTLPANAGVMRPIDVQVPDHSLLAAKFPAPVGGYTETILRMIDVIFSAAAKVAPDRVVANAYGTINALSMAGKRANGQPWVMFSFFGGGHGGSAESDGLNHGNAPISTATIPPMEILEAAYPVMFRQWALRPDSAGSGTHRGGLGAIYEIELLEENAEAFLFGERGRFAPQGVAGGQAGAKNHFKFQQGDGWHTPPLTSKMRGIKLEKGQAVRLETPGGGGYGDPKDRAAVAISRDVSLGYQSPEDATRIYGKHWREAKA